jgi:hypothetical protein
MARELLAPVITPKVAVFGMLVPGSSIGDHFAGQDLPQVRRCCAREILLQFLARLSFELGSSLRPLIPKEASPKYIAPIPPAIAK